MCLACGKSLGRWERGVYAASTREPLPGWECSDALASRTVKRRKRRAPPLSTCPPGGGSPERLRGWGTPSKRDFFVPALWRLSMCLACEKSLGRWERGVYAASTREPLPGWECSDALASRTVKRRKRRAPPLSTCPPGGGSPERLRGWGTPSKRDFFVPALWRLIMCLACGKNLGRWERGVYAASTCEPLPGWECSNALASRTVKRRKRRAPPLSTCPPEGGAPSVPAASGYAQGQPR